MKHPHVSRRGFLRGVGVCVALPTLESLWPGGATKAFAAAAESASAAAAPLATTATGMPLRMAFVAFANGVNYPRWVPKGEGKNFELRGGFSAVTDLKDRCQVITTLQHEAAKDWGDGPGDHARAGATFLTGCHA